MFILKDPALAQSLGILSTKANIVGDATWNSYLELLAQAISIGGLLVFGFITSWIFGREYSDNTIKDLLALPISRGIIVIAKSVVIILWCLILPVYILGLGFFIGKIVDIPGYSPDIVRQNTFIFIVCSVLTALLSTPVGLFASIGKGYLSPLGFVIFTLMLAQIVAAIGYGEYFPWSIPAIISGMTGKAITGINISSILIVLITSILGLAGTVIWWRYADQT